MPIDATVLEDRLLKGLARKLARRTEGVASLPAELRIPARPDEWPSIPELGRRLGLAAYQERGRAVFRIPPELRDVAAPKWTELRAAFAPKPDDGAGAAEEVFRKARLVAPGDVVDALKDDAAVVRFVRRGPDSARDFLRLLEWAAPRAADAPGTPATLSQLGSDILGDSKALRSGARRAVFERILAASAGLEPDAPARDALARFGIEDNPFTGNATVFAPFSFTLESGETFDFPERMFREGLAVQLPRQTVSRIAAVRLSLESRRLVTSENAAPFDALVQSGVPCVYTEGYPNAAVVRLLGLFAEAGARCVHAGDGDLDGLRIADIVASAIPVDRVIADELAESDDVSRRPVAPSARNRWEAFLATHPDFPHARTLRASLLRGWPEQESFPAALWQNGGYGTIASIHCNTKERKIASSAEDGK